MTVCGVAAKAKLHHPNVVIISAQFQSVSHSSCTARTWTAKAVVTTVIRLRFDAHSTAVRPRYDNSTTYVTAGLLHCGLSN